MCIVQATFYVRLLRQEPFFERPSLSQGAELPFPYLAKEDDAEIGAAEVLLGAVRDGPLPHLRDVVLRMHESDLVLEVLVEILEPHLA